MKNYRTEQSWYVCLSIISGLKIKFLFPLLACLLSACFEEGMTLTLDGNAPPTFTMSGSGNLSFFTVIEIASKDQKLTSYERDPDKDKVLWEIWPNNLSYEDRRIRRLSPITYGQIPVGFIQKTPRDGVVPTLVEGKIYEAGGPASNAHGGFIRFIIRDGKSIEVPMPD